MQGIYSGFYESSNSFYEISTKTNGSKIFSLFKDERGTQEKERHNLLL